MKKALLIFCSIGFLFSSCTDETLSTSEVKESNYKNGKVMPDVDDGFPEGTTTEAKIKWNCPTPTNYPCTDIFQTLDDMTGSNYGNNSNGKLDKLLNCPYLAYEYCERQCESVTITHGYSLGVGWIATWTENGEPCGPDGIFSAAEQTAFLNQIKALALSEAPACGNGFMEPVYYNVFWDTISFTNFYIGVKITYISPCQYTPGPGGDIPLDSLSNGGTNG